ncbi:variable surface protein, partial [Plasmodium gonderi]
MEGELGVCFLYNDDELKELPTNINYAIFDEEKGNCDGVFFYDSVLSRIDTERWIYKTPYHISKALCYVYKKRLENDFDLSICNYLYYWLIDVLYKNLYFRDFFYTNMELFKFLLNCDGGMSICNYDNYEINQDNFMDIKLIFDFSKDYDKLVEYFRVNDRLCSSNFKKYFDQYIRTYNKYKEKCEKSNNKDTSCRAFENYLKHKDYNIISKWSFTSNGNAHNFSSVQKKVSIEHTNILQGGYGIEQLKNIYEEVPISVTKGTVEIRDPVITGYPEEVQEVMITPGGKTSYLHSHGLDRYDDTQEFRIISYISSNTSLSSTSNGMVITPILVVIVVFFIILYKFTPFGYWLKK